MAASRAGVQGDGVDKTTRSCGPRIFSVKPVTERLAPTSSWQIPARRTRLPSPMPSKVTPGGATARNVVR